ncbi:insulinase family protein [Okeania sp.]|uniref:insulinase family protein n=1 Tax=Okeania sp. TaxID=3100323 RepID=UPI002B4B09CE|nr:insulinase family protein [Okeania sp.]MEB3342344.1 insulinase family protein [Okeania sp.]
MPILTERTLEVGQQLEGFEVKAITDLKQQQMVAYQLEHLKTGAKLLHLYSEDAENLFSISFPTPPPNSTGIPHILEHSVLAGSKKYPVKEPFFEMLKMSPATFINAMTGPDCTYYPVSSKVKQDLFNLAEVYFDAVFHPLLTENTFKREGHHLAPADPENPTGKLKFTGVVYNEMSGAFSDPEQRLESIANQILFPDNIYGLESGGDPKNIPELTYEDFREFHANYYHPSNAHFVFYGNIPTPEYLNFLAGKLDVFERREPNININPQSRWSEPQFKEEPYPVSAADETTEKTYILLKWLVGDSTNSEEWVAWDILSRILLGNEAAPLKKAIIESQIGKDLLRSGNDSVGKEATFVLGIQGSEPDQGEAFTQLVINTLKIIADGEIEPSMVEGAFQQAIYQHQEVARMYPLRMLFRVMQTWIYDSDPLAFLQISDRLAECKQRYAENPNYFNDLIREKLLDNPHRLTLVLKPDQEWQANYDQAVVEQVEQVRSQLTPEQLEQIAKEAEELQLESGTPNAPEAVAKLPQLQVSDLPEKPEHIPTDVEEIDGGVTLLRNHVLTNGVNYLQLDFSLRGLPEELWLYVSVYIDALRKLGAGEMNYEQVARGITAYTGGIGFQSQLRTYAQDAYRPVYGLRVTMKTLDEQIEPALELLRNIIFAVNPRDTARLREVMTQSLAQSSSDLIYNGMYTAMSRAGAGMTKEASLSEIVNGLPQLELLNKVCARFDEHGANLMTQIETIRDFIANQPLTASFTGSDGAYEVVKKTLSEWGSQQQQQEGDIFGSRFEPIYNIREGLAGPVQVAYCVQMMPAPHFSDERSPLLKLGAHLLGLGYLFTEIRLKGNAYGAGCRYSGLGKTVSLYSYRDPHVTRTLDVFAGIIDYLKNLDWTQTDVDRAIIATTQDDSPVLRPEVATSLALERYLTAQTAELREERYERSLKATVADVKQTLLDVFTAGMERNNVCVMSSREKLAAANGEMEAEPLKISDIM